jgi:Protein of unknown function (DUF998)
MSEQGTLDRRARTVRMLVTCGVVAGPFYVVVSLAQALTRDGFDLARHPWSLLSNGGLGWVQITNFLLTGLLTVGCAVGVRRALGGTWAPRLIAAYGVSLIAAGVFRADPALGFPRGTPADAATVSWHGTLHFVAGAVGFTCLIAACFVLARRFGADGRRGWATYSRITGVLFLAGFVGIASGGGNPVTNVAFVVAVVLAWSWLTAVAVHLRPSPYPAPSPAPVAPSAVDLGHSRVS